MSSKIYFRVCVAAVVLLASCGVWRYLTGTQSKEAEYKSPTGLKFPHKRHLEESLECTTCHPGAESSDNAGFVSSIKKCGTCHDGIDEEKPTEKHVSLYEKDGKPQFSNVSKLDDGIKFSHKLHHDREIKCAECHRGIEDAQAILTSFKLTMDDCINCHKSKNASTECSACHKEDMKATKPASHMQNWKQNHGGVYRTGYDSSEVSSKCSLCHSDSSCLACHQIERPRNHTDFWRTKGHGVNASFDRETCATCHRVDFCVRCHKETAPRSHVSSWFPPTSRHCYSCHIPGGTAEEGCAVCHKEPVHTTAPKRPSNAQHAVATAATCRTCHTAIGIPHPDNGDTCTACH